MKLNVKILFAAVIVSQLYAGMCFADKDEDLIAATKNGDTAAVECLLKAGAHVKVKQE